MFLSDGNIDQVDLDSGAVVHIGPAWQPVTPQFWADAVVWRPNFVGSAAGQQGGVLFGSPAGLYAWDGATLTPPGANAPDWLTDQAETDPASPPTVMPIGLPGIYSMEVYDERLWVSGKDVISFSAPSNGADFDDADGGGSFGYFGNKLTYTFNDLNSAAGYLFCFGDSSTDVVANVTLTTNTASVENPVLTIFSYSNLDPVVGHRFPRKTGNWGRYKAMFNGAGIWLMTGGVAQTIGEKTTSVYMTMDTSRYLPTMALATMFGFRLLLCNGRFTDPFGVTRSMMLVWNGASWCVMSQGLELTHIG